MTSFRVLVAGCVLSVLAADAAPATAAWDNVFQVCCFHCRRPTVASYVAPAVPVQAYSAPCCDPCCPQTTCTTYYVQRCYYQPVTTYQTRTYYEPVTTYQTSYYYEPVTTYRYSCYIDPCTGCPQQVAVPCTSYQLKARTCPVQSWVQRCCLVPVTTYQRCTYWEPHTTCSTAPACCPSTPSCCPSTAPAPAVTPQPPTINEQRTLPPAGTQPQQQYYTPQPPVINEQRSSGSTAAPSYRYYGQGEQKPTPTFTPPPPPPVVRLDRIVLGNETPRQQQLAQTRATAETPAVFVPVGR
jgi:hypothetical protein